MTEINPLTHLMQTTLPSKRYQKRLLYQLRKEEVFEAYWLLNHYVFENKLKTPSINLRSMPYWGLCSGYDIPDHFSKIRLAKRMYCVQWMVTILAHEMAHQYTWDIHGVTRLAQNKTPLMSHRGSFFEFKPKLAEYGIPLKAEYSAAKWFEHQDIMKA